MSMLPRGSFFCAYSLDTRGLSSPMSCTISTPAGFTIGSSMFSRSSRA